MIWAPYFERNTIISNTCVVRYAYICADVAIIEDYCYARCLPVSRAAPHYRCSQRAGAALVSSGLDRRVVSDLCGRSELRVAVVSSGLDRRVVSAVCARRLRLAVLCAAPVGGAEAGSD